MKNFYSAIIGIILTLGLCAQDNKITLKILNQRKEPLSFASVTITSQSDSLQVHRSAADSNGIAIFKLSKGLYHVRVTSASYQDIEKGISVTGNQVIKLMAEPLPKTLGQVTVTTQKPL